MSGEQQEARPAQGAVALPDWYTDGQYDALLICAAADKAAADGFVKFVRTVLYTEHERAPTFTTLDTFSCGENGLKRAQYLLDKSTFVFLFVTDNYIKDDLCALLTDELVMDCVRNGDCRWRLIPVIPRPVGYPLPMGLKSLNALSLSRLMVCDRVTDSLKALSRENLKYFDSYIAKNVRKLFEDRAFLLRRREKMDDIKLAFWKATQGAESGEESCVKKKKNPGRD